MNELIKLYLPNNHLKSTLNKKKMILIMEEDFKVPQLSKEILNYKLNILMENYKLIEKEINHCCQNKVS